jgi:hypothetical protein
MVMSAKRASGRPSKLTPARRERLVDLAGQGVPVATAARVVGIHRDTFFAWLQRGEAAIERRERGEHVGVREIPFVEFADAIGTARAEAETRAVQVIADAMDRDWRAAAWFLEHSLPGRWGRRGRAEIDVVHHDVTALNGQLQRGHQLRLEAETRLALTAAHGDSIDVAEIVEEDIDE